MTSSMPIPSVPIELLLAKRNRLIEAARKIREVIDEQLDTAADREWLSAPRIEGSRYNRDTEEWGVKEATKMIDKAAWQELICSGPIWSSLDATARDEWRASHEKGELPPFTEENVKAEAERLITNRGEMMKRGVSTLFSRLSSSHLTNQDGRFTKKMILRYVCESWKGCSLSPNFNKMNTLDDLDRTLHLLRGLPEPVQTGERGAYGYVRKAIAGDNVAVFPFFKIKLFANGNGHLTLDHDADVMRLNKVLSMGATNAIPRSTVKRRANG